ncbi:uncharacterized protein SPAPADRAFT_58986 [Spathaspora passalidarum NRRL Y-27907]|uniref:Zn(2)-C6 fungal-type domain-containing protein n=1 Tax=Spathaspora passalidarum (strain NRRL Y-27907 / 11-Y1) TaxID=619300 RepID=G3AEV0_SPAPN|nr:uncharacterized protein SPAPADRAFT_58986 [Spathaspora passalidarum NRRL Y-27907]EGW35780.1 hypothetical protein SPAPADRAFT_58986 [Spathaspora passalidarum NRRL Y-27907]
MNTWQASNWHDSSEPSNDIQQNSNSGSDVTTSREAPGETNSYSTSNSHPNSTADPPYRAYPTFQQPPGPVPGLAPPRGVYIPNTNYVVQPNDADITKLQATTSVYQQFQPPPQPLTYLPGEYGAPGQSGNPQYQQQQHPAMIPVPVGQYPMPPEFSSYQGMNSSTSDQHQQQGWDPYNSLPRIRPPLDGDKGSPSFKSDKKIKKKPKTAKKSVSGSPSSDSAANPTNKPLTKRSRMGCLTCRHRKKRCCETRPRCTECTRLRLKCTWPKPGTEYKNKPKDAKNEENVIDHEIYGKIKVLRGIVEYKSK